MHHQVGKSHTSFHTSISPVTILLNVRGDGAHFRTGRLSMTHQDAYELAWKENKDKLIRMAYKNTFNALALAAELFWNLATEEAKREVKDDSKTDTTV